MVQPSRSDAADVHAGPLANGVEALEHGDVFRRVVRGCHVYNVRLLKELTRVPLMLCLTIVAAFEAGLAAQVTISEDVPVPGGIAAIADALGIDPLPDRARFVGELTRLVYDTPAGRNAAGDLRLDRVRALVLPASSPSDASQKDVVPIPLTTAIWSEAIFHRPLQPNAVFVAILKDRQASLLCH